MAKLHARGDGFLDAPGTAIAIPHEPRAFAVDHARYSRNPPLDPVRKHDQVDTRLKPDAGRPPGKQEGLDSTAPPRRGGLRGEMKS